MSVFYVCIGYLPLLFYLLCVCLCFSHVYVSVCQSQYQGMLVYMSIGFVCACVSAMSMYRFVRVSTKACWSTCLWAMCVPVFQPCLCIGLSEPVPRHAGLHVYGLCMCLCLSHVYVSVCQSQYQGMLVYMSMGFVCACVLAMSMYRFVRASTKACWSTCLWALYVPVS